MKQYAFLIYKGKIVPSTKDPKGSLKIVINLKANDINIRTEYGRETEEEKEKLISRFAFLTVFCLIQ